MKWTLNKSRLHYIVPSQVSYGVSVVSILGVKSISYGTTCDHVVVLTYLKAICKFIQKHWFCIWKCQSRTQLLISVSMISITISNLCMLPVTHNSVLSSWSQHWWNNGTWPYHGLVQERCNSSALALKSRLSCTKPSISALLPQWN